MQLPTRRTTIRFVSPLSRLALKLSLLNLPLAAFTSIVKHLPLPPEYLPPGYKAAIENYTLGSIAAVLCALSFFVLSKTLFKRSRWEQEIDYRAVAEELAYRQAVRSKQISKECHSCCYFAGSASPIRCAVNPVGDAGNCRDWRGRS